MPAIAAKREACATPYDICGDVATNTPAGEARADMAIPRILIINNPAITEGRIIRYQYPTYARIREKMKTMINEMTVAVCWDLEIIKAYLLPCKGRKTGRGRPYL
ncbi:MAG TPA: hypothetical protein VKU79_00940 [Thermoplasmataceae archaeon]|nr:hypothetical protein [Thermoplasmataceae archaeon]